MRYETLKDDDLAVGAALAEMRSDVGMTQRELADRTGIDLTAISRIEGGTRRLGFAEAVRCCKAMGKTVPAFLRKLTWDL